MKLLPEYGLSETTEARRPWVAHAACKYSDTSLFYDPEDSEIAAAVAVCRTCPVQAECLAFALETGENFGVWGGTTETERKKLWRQIKDAANPRYAQRRLVERLTKKAS